MIEFFKQQLQHNPFFLTAFIAGIVAMVGAYFKDGIHEIYGLITRRLIFTCCIYQNDPLFSDFEIWFYANYGEKYRNVEASVNKGIENYPLSDQGRPGKTKGVFFRQSEGIFFINYKGKFILIKKGKEKMEHATDARSLFFNQYHFYAIRGSKKVKDLLETAVIFAAQKAKANELKIYANTGWGEWQISSRISAKNIENVIIKSDNKKTLTADMDVFLSAKEEYDKRHIFYKRGYCFHGGPGNGKTSLALAMASYMNKDIHSLDLNSLNDNNALRMAFVNLNGNSLLLIEDIDGYFKLREPVKKDNKISFSTLLNCIDGALYKEGLVTIITTNKKDFLDPALIRAGRIDYMFEIPRPGTDEVNNYLQRFYNQEDEFNPIIYSGLLSMCEIQEICLNNKTDKAEAIEEILTKSHSKLKSA